MTISGHFPVQVKGHLAIVYEGVDIAPRDADEADLTRLGYVKIPDAYDLIRRSLALALTGDSEADLTDDGNSDTVANAVRHLVETALFYERVSPDAVVGHVAERADEVVALRAALGTKVP